MQGSPSTRAGENAPVLRVCGPGDRAGHCTYSTSFRGRPRALGGCRPRKRPPEQRRSAIATHPFRCTVRPAPDLCGSDLRLWPLGPSRPTEHCGPSRPQVYKCTGAPRAHRAPAFAPARGLTAGGAPRRSARRGVCRLIQQQPAIYNPPLLRLPRTRQRTAPSQPPAAVRAPPACPTPLCARRAATFSPGSNRQPALVGRAGMTWPTYARAPMACAGGERGGNAPGQGARAARAPRRSVRGTQWAAQRSACTVPRTKPGSDWARPGPDPSARAGVKRGGTRCLGFRSLNLGLQMQPGPADAAAHSAQAASTLRQFRSGGPALGATVRATGYKIATCATRSVGGHT